MNTLRFSGLMSGMDTDNIVQQLMRPYQMRVDRVIQDKQYIEWQRDAFRDITNQIKVFKDDFFNYLNPSNNMRSAATYNSFNINYNGQDNSEYLSVTAGSSAVQGTYTINNIILAEGAKEESTEEITAEIIGESIEELTINEDNNRFSLTFNGVRKTIILEEGTYSTELDNFEDLKDDLQTKINDAFGLDRIEVEFVGNKQIKFSEIGEEKTDYIRLSSVTGNQGLAALGFTEETNIANRISMNSNLASISNSFALADGLNIAEGEDINFIINDVEFSFDSSKLTLGEIINTINNSQANVNIRYNELQDIFEIESDKTGVTAKLEINDVTGNLMEVLGLNNTETFGEDANLTINGKTVTRSSNSFTVNGLNFNLTNNYIGEDIEVSVTANPEETGEKIINFVEKYNELIANINSKINEPQDRDYRPLTDEQKEEMSEREIELWEKRAKSGILRRDPLLERMLSNMRTTMFQTPEGVSLSLFDLGITTSSNYLDGGKLIVDEAKLNQAIAEDPQGVVDLFSQSSDESEQLGIAHRLFDIIEDNIRTTRDNRGRKGLLLEKAGIEGDTSEINNYLNQQILGYENRINDILDMMARQEENYYRMFTRMESALAEMYAQSDWLTAQLGNMN